MLKSITSLPVGTVLDFDYTGTVLLVTLPPGKYKLQCWGALGGNEKLINLGVGSYGGYSEGTLTLSTPTTLFIFVGGKGDDYTGGKFKGGWNGGGGSTGSNYYGDDYCRVDSYFAAGGGATDICTVSSTMEYDTYRTVRSLQSLLSRFIVAGGGGGGSFGSIEETVQDSSEAVEVGNYGSDTIYDPNTGRTYVLYNIYDIIEPGYTYYIDSIFPSDYINGEISVNYLYNGWGLYTCDYSVNIPEDIDYVENASLYVLWHNSYTTWSNVVIYRLPYSGSPSSEYNSDSSYSLSCSGGGTTGGGWLGGTLANAGFGGSFGLGANAAAYLRNISGGGGGGGWYGGGSSSGYDVSYALQGSGGGSGFVYTTSYANRVPSGYTGLKLDSGYTKNGAEGSFPSPNGSSENGHSGNGYAKITVLSNDPTSDSGGDSGGNTGLVNITWSLIEGEWESDGDVFYSVSPGANGSARLRCTFSGISEINFRCNSDGEDGYDYLTVGYLDEECTRDTYKHTFKNERNYELTVIVTCTKDEHFVEFCYSKDGSVDSDPDRATVYIASYKT